MSYAHHTVLVVDDNPDDAHFTKLALERVGVITILVDPERETAVVTIGAGVAGE